MKLIRYDNDMNGSITTYDVDNIDIRQATNDYGRSNDTLELYDDNDKLIARAIWPMGYKCYKYATGKNLHKNPAWCVYVY